MQLRNKLSLYFTLISSLLMLMVMTLIYLLFKRQTINDFYRELHERTEVAAQVYLEADETSKDAFEKIKKKFVISLPKEVIRFYDSNGNQAFINEQGQNWSNDIIQKVRLRGHLEYAINGKQVVGINYEDNQGDFVILAQAEDVYGKMRQRNLLEILTILFLAQILVQFWAGRWFAKRTLMPIQKINEEVQQISATDLHLRVSGPSEKDELGTLVAHFNALLSRLEHSFDLQRKFVANASHELKTPITNMMGEIEVTLNRERSSHEYQVTLHSVLAEVERLHDIVQNFLLLANEDNAGHLQQSDPVWIDELLWELKNDFATESRQQQHLEINITANDEGVFCIKANRTLLLLALSNIIRNGFKFSNNQPVHCHLFAMQDEIHLSISDKGIGIDASEMKNIFEPFYRSSDASTFPGHGMGLYITHKIITLFGGKIMVHSKTGAGSTFNISFKKMATI